MHKPLPISQEEWRDLYQHDSLRKSWCLTTETPEILAEKFYGVKFEHNAYEDNDFQYNRTFFCVQGAPSSFYEPLVYVKDEQGYIQIKVIKRNKDLPIFAYELDTYISKLSRRILLLESLIEIEQAGDKNQLSHTTGIRAGLLEARGLLLNILKKFNHLF